MNRDDFEILKTNVIYFDNGATTLKPKVVLDSIVDYYTKFTANAHRGDYDNSLIVDKLYEGTRSKVAKFINALRSDEIVFTKGTTESLNIIVFGFMKKVLTKKDEVILSKAEHASNVLPWLELQKEIGFKIKYVPLDKDLKLTFESLKSIVTKNTKVISLAHITNTVGDIRPIKQIGEFAKNNNIYFVVDGAQSVPHLKTDVQDLNCDFLAFSGHKMLGPTGIGVLYGRYSLLDKTDPINFGGGMNTSFESNGEFEYKSLPTRLEAGTQNIEGVIGLGAAIDYLSNIGMDNIHKYEIELRKYLIDKLETVSNVFVYNKNSDSGIVMFNLDGVFAQDTAVYLNNYHICVRAGNHCAKILKDEIGVTNTCRVSLYFYNTKEDIYKLVEALDTDDILCKSLI